MYIYCLPILLPWDKTDSQLLKNVSLKRQKKIEKYVFEVDRKLSLYAALLARLSLSIVSGLPAQELIMGLDTKQKPILLSDSNLYFNLSHTRGFVLCGISNNSEIGVDVEKLAQAPTEIMENFFHPEEIQYVENASALEQNLRFYEIWTRKEAYTKKLGTGLICNLPAINTLSLEFSPILHTWMYTNYVCSVCCESINYRDIKYISESDIRAFFVDLYADHSFFYE